MIHQLLNLTRPLHLLDTETTGVDPARDRIIEIGFQTWDATGLKYEWRSYVNPGIPIPAEVTKITGISHSTMLDCRRCGLSEISHSELPEDIPIIAFGEISDEDAIDLKPTTIPFKYAGQCREFKLIPRFAQIAEKLARGFSDCDFAGQNVRFDLRILAAEFARVNVTWGYLGARILDSSRLEALAVPRSLLHLYRKYKGELKDAHSALGDAKAAGEVIVAQLQRYSELPRDLDALHELQFPGWIDPEGKFRFVEGVACFSQWGKYANQPMTAADNGYWDFILLKDFSPDVKALAAAAKLGQFPTRKG